MSERLSAYTAHPDPAARVAGLIALVLAGNQPFYPLYLHAAVGIDAWPSWITLASVPFFAVVPLLARRRSVWGRAMLPAAGIANTALTALALGSAAATQLFFLPCLLLGGLLFRPGERIWAFAVCAAGIAAYAAVDGRSGLAGVEFSPAQFQAMAAINIGSTAMLMIFLGLVCASAFLPDRDQNGAPL